MHGQVGRDAVHPGVAKHRNRRYPYTASALRESITRAACVRIEFRVQRAGLSCQPRLDEEGENRDVQRLDSHTP